jgi:hypothetical protein
VRPEEYDTVENKLLKKEFDESVSKRLGKPLKDDNLPTSAL